MALEVNYGGKEEWNKKVLVSLVSSCKKKKATSKIVNTEIDKE